MTYFHRVGRTARKGTEGTAISLVSLQEMNYFQSIKKITKTKIDELKAAKGPTTQESPIVGFY